MTLKHVLRHTLLALALLSPVATATDAVQISMPRQDNTIGLRYLVFETGGAGAEDSLPMIVGLHYSGAEPQVMVEYFDTLNIKARIVLPRGPYARPEGRSWFPAQARIRLHPQPAPSGHLYHVSPRYYPSRSFPPGW